MIGRKAAKSHGNQQVGESALDGDRSTDPDDPQNGVQRTGTSCFHGSYWPKGLKKERSLGREQLCKHRSWKMVKTHSRLGEHVLTTKK